MLGSADAIGDLADVGSRVLRLDRRDDESTFWLNCHPTLGDVRVSLKTVSVSKVVIKQMIRMIKQIITKIRMIKQMIRMMKAPLGCTLARLC